MVLTWEERMNWDPPYQRGDPREPRGGGEGGPVFSEQAGPTSMPGLPGAEVHSPVLAFEELQALFPAAGLSSPGG